MLATKCRFCGESVGRPKDEARSLTIEDLGGETVVHYAPSSNVMEALEAFRMEEGTNVTPEPKKKTLFGRKAASTDSQAPMKSDPGVMDLDERGKALASLMVPTRTAAPPSRSNDPTWMKKLAFLGGFVAVVVILYFGGIQVSAAIRNWGAEENVKSAFHNPAPDMMKEGKPAIEVHKAAFAAVQKDDSPDNREILADARQQVADEIDDLLNAPTVALHSLRAASNLAAAAWQEDRSPEIQGLKAQVDAENSIFGMNLISVDTTVSPRTAVIQLSDKSRITVKPNDMIQDRLQVQTISDKYVRLIDTKRKTPTGVPRSVQVDTEGIPK
ncbi:MAG: hypothetical protein RBU21_02185 [FCB group bacterium]|nr:hypothetical protein [FCB group bacterium]